MTCYVLSIARVLTPVLSRRADIDGVRGAQYANSGQVLLASKICTRGEYFGKRRGGPLHLGGGYWEKSGRLTDAVVIVQCRLSRMLAP